MGPETLGRIINVIGEPIDERGPVNAKKSVVILNVLHDCDAVFKHEFDTKIFMKYSFISTWHL